MEKNKITSIKRKTQKEDTLPDGSYIGTWGGSEIEVTYKGTTYILSTKEGVRGFGYKVIITITGADMTFNEVNN